MFVACDATRASTGVSLPMAGRMADRSNGPQWRSVRTRRSGDHYAEDFREVRRLIFFERIVYQLQSQPLAAPAATSPTHTYTLTSSYTHTHMRAHMPITAPLHEQNMQMHMYTRIARSFV